VEETVPEEAMQQAIELRSGTKPPSPPPATA
jgi:hypothetical protein